MSKNLSLLDVASTNNYALEEYHKLIAFLDSIENYKTVLIGIIKCAETEKQIDGLDLLVNLFKNKFKREPTLIKHVWEIEAEIYKLRSQFF